MAHQENSPILEYPQSLNVLQEAGRLAYVLCNPQLSPESKGNVYTLVSKLREICEEVMQIHHNENPTLQHSLGATAVSVQMESLAPGL